MTTNTTDTTNTPNITITQAEYDGLVRDSLMLLALESAGVDNWDGYDNAIEIASDLRSEYGISDE